MYIDVRVRALSGMNRSRCVFADVSQQLVSTDCFLSASSNVNLSFPDFAAVCLRERLMSQHNNAYEN